MRCHGSPGTRQSRSGCRTYVASTTRRPRTTGTGCRPRRSDTSPTSGAGRVHRSGTTLRRLREQLFEEIARARRPICPSLCDEAVVVRVRTEEGMQYPKLPAPRQDDEATSSFARRQRAAGDRRTSRSVSTCVLISPVAFHGLRRRRSTGPLQDRLRPTASDEIEGTYYGSVVHRQRELLHDDRRGAPPVSGGRPLALRAPTTMVPGNDERFFVSSGSAAASATCRVFVSKLTSEVRSRRSRPNQFAVSNRGAKVSSTGSTTRRPIRHPAQRRRADFELAEAPSPHPATNWRPSSPTPGRR